MQIAIIGAGMAGLAAANAFASAGHSVALFDKGRGAGGRMSTRRLTTPLGEAGFDYGAQYFTARDPAFVRVVRDWQDSGIATPWPLAGKDAWIGTPGMNAVIKHMAASHQITWNCLVGGAFRNGDQWWLSSNQGEAGPFDAIILAIPAEQAAAFLSLLDFGMARVAMSARSQPCWAAMFAFDQRLNGLPDIIRQDGDIAWAARNNAKSGRTGPEAWIVQAMPAWSVAHLECPQDEILRRLHATLEATAGHALPAPVAASAHRWRYALSAGTSDGALWNPLTQIGVCGDWLLGPRVECAWLSGQTLVQRVLASYPPQSAVTCPNVHV